jgi:glycosyltransferase involved in cell wall biosynthesis
LHVHGGSFAKRYHKAHSLYKWFTRATLNRCREIIALSAQWQTFFESIVTSPHVSVVHLGIDCSSYQRHEPGNSSETRIVFIGNLTQPKGVSDIIQAIPEIIKHNTNVKFVFVGCELTPGEEAGFRKECSDLDIDRWVEFTGQLNEEDVRDQLNRASIFLLPSYAEGLPLALAEAMAFSLPSVVTPVGGIPDIIKDGVNGFIVNPGDVSALAKVVIALIQDPSLRFKLGAEARQTVVDLLSNEANAEQIKEVYNRVIS